MKISSFRTPEGRATFGIVTGDQIIDLGAERRHLPSLKDFLCTDEFVSGAVTANGPEYLLSAITFLPVIPNPGKVFCVALNYRDPEQDDGRPDPEYPALFLRTASSQAAHRAPLVKPNLTDRFDYEGELSLIIGKPGRNIARDDASTHIAGYACYNDCTARDWQRHTHQWTPGKNFDGTGGFGPWLSTKDEMKRRDQTWLITRVNGKEMQKAALSQMIFSAEDLIVYISKFTRLETGDVIVTGTPSGVGDRRTPPFYLAAGDRVEVEIDGVGILENTIALEAPEQ